MDREMFYQPIYASKKVFNLIRSRRFDLISQSDFKSAYGYERTCLDRLIIFSRDLFLIGLQPNSTILDLGCNIGFFSHSLQAMGYKVTGVENNIAYDVLGFSKEKPLDTARRLSEEYKVYPEFFTEDIVDYLQKSVKYDVVLCLNIIHHFFKGYASQGKVAIETEDLQSFLKLLSDTTLKVMYLEYNEEFSESFGWGRDQIEHLILSSTDFREIKKVGITVGAGGDCRYVYRCEK
ncbi:class I SAM-dependent methyltransferase [Paenibacillus assamensis]|uniref:class I SAM-dependent methyltransferase n=1 Tax=Paenibacillus assamensis TaxID=311244 RepID=UPI000406971A|nr:SAM-dependent methyltransferase [Paenibacillus assamensis]